MFGALMSRRAGRGAVVYEPSGDNAALIEDILNGHVIPFSYDQPTDPLIADEVLVTPATLAANIVSGRRAILQPGVYSPTWAVEDFEFVCQPGASFSGMHFDGGSIRGFGASGGSTITTAPTFSSGTLDLMLDNFRCSQTGPTDSLIPNNIDRVCFRHWTLTADENWGVIGGDGSSNLLWLACDLEYTGANSSRSPLRIVAVPGLVIFKTRFASTQAGVRLHNNDGGAMSNLAFEQNHLECGLFIDPSNSGPGGDGSGLVLGPSWVRDNNSYRPGVSQMYDIGTHTQANLQNATFTGNRGYGSAVHGSAMTTINLGSGSTNSNNLNQTYISTPATPQCGVQ